MTQRGKLLSNVKMTELMLKEQGGWTCKRMTVFAMSRITMMQMLRDEDISTSFSDMMVDKALILTGGA
jgi:hypothetical protein